MAFGVEEKELSQTRLEWLVEELERIIELIEDERGGEALGELEMQSGTIQSIIDEWTEDE